LPEDEAMKSRYHLSHIRALFVEGFSLAELRALCYDHFQPVYNQLGDTAGKQQVVTQLLEHAHATMQMDTLLALAKEANPARYAAHEPYYAQCLRKERKAVPDKSRPVWAWLGWGALALFVLGGSFLGIRAAFRSRARRPPLTAIRIRARDGAAMVYMPADEFWMGSDEGDANVYDDEKPRHRVWVDAFWIDRTEVTNAQYRVCVEAGACSEPQRVGSHGREDYYGNPTYDDYPVVYVTWHQARRYAEWVGGRLCTEAEWEYACRGARGHTFPWGDSPPHDKLLNYDSGLGDTTRVGSYPEGKNSCGVLDLSGNVWEWTQSLYEGYPYDATDGREALDASGVRVVRSGGFESSARSVRCAFRFASFPDFEYAGYGFRVCAAAQ
jgi:formylglycine-generating enzyme required for sulfatase activity